MAVNPRFFHADQPIDRDNLYLPEVIVDSFEDTAEKILRTPFDAVWQATGWPRSVNYDEEGNWSPRSAG
jgi:hypothetical protein